MPVPSNAIRASTVCGARNASTTAAVSGFDGSRVSIRSGKFETIWGCAAAARKSACIRSATSSIPSAFISVASFGRSGKVLASVVNGRLRS